MVNGLIELGLLLSVRSRHARRAALGRVCVKMLLSAIVSQNQTEIALLCEIHIS